MGIPAALSSVPAQTPYIQYVATSGQTVFPYPFEITQDSDLVAVANGTTLATDSGYTLSGVGNSTGGNLTFTSGRTADDIITLYRDIPIERLTQFAQNGGFSSAAFNAEFNNVYLLLQQLQQNLDQCLQIPNTNNPAPTVSLTPGAYASKYLAFDANGNPTPAQLTSSGSLTQGIVAGLLFPQTTAEAAVSVTPTNEAVPHHTAAGVVLPARYGATASGNRSGGGTDDSVALADALLVAAQAKVPLMLSGVYRCDAALTVPNNVSIIGCGPELTAIDGTNVPGATGAVLNCTGPAFVALPALSVNVSVGDTALTFAAAPSVSKGDKIIIWNPTNSSYSGFRTYYTAGECCEVLSLAGNVVTVKTPIYAAYTAANVNCYQLTPTSNHIRDLAVIAPATIVQGINFTRIVGGGTRNVKVRGSGYIQIENLNCYDMHHENGDCFELLNVSNGYGISFDNSQDCLVLGGKYCGYFSGISTGGSSQTGSHVNRNIRAIGATTSSAQHVQGDGSANMHGNSEYCYYDHCTIFDGLNLAGNHCGARNSIIIVSSAALGVGVLFTEMSGCDHDLSGTRISCAGNPNTGSSAIIDIGVNNVTAMNANTTSGGTISLRGVKISAGAATGNAVFIRNRGATVTYDVDCTAMQIDAPNISGAGVSTIPVSGNDPVAIHLEGARFSGTTLPANTVPFASITAANTKVTGYRCQGSVGLNTATGAPDVATAVSFPRPAPKTPNVFCSCNQTLGGSTDSYIVAPVGVTSSGFNAEVANGKAVNFTAVIALTVAWTAMLDETV